MEIAKLECKKLSVYQVGYKSDTKKKLRSQSADSICGGGGEFITGIISIDFNFQNTFKNNLNSEAK